MWGGGGGLPGCDPGGLRCSAGQEVTGPSSPLPEPPDHIHSWGPHPPLGWDDYSRPIEDTSEDEELLAFREYWLGEHGQSALKEWLNRGPNYKPPCQPWPPTNPWPPLVAEWCQTCEDYREVEMDITGLVEEKELEVVKEQGKEEKEQAREEKVMEQELKVARGEVTPPASPRQVGEQMKSPGTQAKQLARLLQFQQQLSEEFGLPPSRLQERRILEQETTPSPSSPSSPERKQFDRVGKDLKKEFERIGAEALLLPLSIPTEGALDRGGQQEEDQPKPAGCGGEEEWSHADAMATDCAARGYGIKSTRRQVDAVGGGVGSTTTPTTSLVWWYQPWGLGYWSSITFYCAGCQGGLGSC